MPEASRCQPDVPGNSRLVPKARGLGQLSRLTRVRFRGPVGSTGCPGALGPGSEGLRCRPALLGASGPCRRANGVHQFRGRLRPVSEGPRGQPVVPVIRALVRVPAGSISSPVRLALVSEAPRGYPDVFGDSGPCPSVRGFDQVSRATRARDQGPTVTTRCPWILQPGSEGLRVRPAVPGRSPSGLMARRVDQMSRATRAWVLGTLGSTSCPG